MVAEAPGPGISTLNYQQSCKVALHYETRFWEAQENPIFGGCGSVDIPGIGSVCYPAYEINSTGPGVLLGSYISGTDARSVAALENRLPDAVRVDVAFKKPVLLPGSVAFGSTPVDDGYAFSLSNPKTGAPHLAGRTTAL